MADYEQAKGGVSALNTGYYRDTFVGFDDYIVIPISSNLTVGIQGNITIDENGNGIAENANIIEMKRVETSGGGYYTHYEVEGIALEKDGSCTFKVSNPCYLYGSFSETPSFILTKNEEYSHQYQIIVCVLLILCCLVHPVIDFARRRWKT